MSAAWNLAAVLDDPDLSPQAKFVYAELAAFAEERRDGLYADPGLKVLSKNMGRSTETVSVCLKELLHAGYIAKRRRGQGNTNVFVGVLPEAHEEALRATATTSPSTKRRSL